MFKRKRKYIVSIVFTKWTHNAQFASAIIFEVAFLVETGSMIGRYRSKERKMVKNER